MTQLSLAPIASLRTFDVVARRSSFRAAADELHVTPSAISHQIKQLETHLACRLFDRTARVVTLTPAGEVLHRATASGFSAMEEALARIRTNSPSVAVTVSSTAAFLNLWLVPRLAEIQATLPDIQLRLHASDTAEKLRRGGIDVAIRYGPGPFPGVPSEMLRRDIFKVICSPSIAISSFDGLQNVPLIHVDGRQRPSVAPDWDRWCSLFDIAGVDPTQGIRFPDSMLAVQAAVAGHGVAIVSEVLVGGLIASGLLVSPFEEGIAGDAYHFACAEELQEDTSIAALRRWFAGALA